MLELRPHQGQKLYVVAYRERRRLPLVTSSQTAIHCNLLDDKSLMSAVPNEAYDLSLTQEGRIFPLVGFFAAPFPSERTARMAFAVYNAFVHTELDRGTEHEYVGDWTQIDGLEVNERGGEPKFAGSIDKVLPFRPVPTGTPGDGLKLTPEN